MNSIRASAVAIAQSMYRLIVISPESESYSFGPRWTCSPERTVLHAHPTQHSRRRTSPKADNMQILWPVTFFRRIKRYPVERRTALVPLRKALTAGKPETLSTPRICVWRPKRRNATNKRTRKETSPIPGRTNRSFIFSSPPNFHALCAFERTAG